MKTTTRPEVKFETFPKLVNGDDCRGAYAWRNGERFACLQRDVQWTRPLASLCESYTGKVVGYLVTFYLDETGTEHRFATLAQARKAIRDAA